jgi:hypothetical protein
VIKMEPSYHRYWLGVTEKLGVAIIAVLALSIPMCALLNYLNFEKNYSEMVRSRYAVLTRDLGRAAEYGFGLGLSLAHFLKMRELILSTQASDAQIHFIRAYDPRGLVLFDTDANQEGKAVPAEWPRAATATPDDGYWSLDEPEYYVVGYALFNAQGIAEGSLAIAYDKAEVATASQRVANDLLRKATIILGGFSIISLIAVYVSSRDIVKRLRNIAQRMLHIAQGTPPQASPHKHPDALETLYGQCEPILANAATQARALDAPGDEKL